MPFVALLQGHMFYTCFVYKDNIKKNLVGSHTIRTRALIFSMKHNLVDSIRHVCANCVHGVKIAPPRGSHVCHRRVNKLLV